MLVHPWDAATEEEWRAVVRDNPFGELIAAGRERARDHVLRRGGA
ncbi:hypothetical protein [Nocardioides sp.]